MNKFNIIFILVLLVASFVSAEESYIFEQDQSADLKTSCFNDDDQLCGSGTTCGITVVHPNSSLVIDNGTMTNNINYYNYTLSSAQTSSTGEYSAVVECTGGTDAYTTFTFEVTPNGEKPTTALGILYIGLFIVIILLFVMSVGSIFKFENPYSKFTMVQVSYLLMIALSFITWNISSNFLTGSPFLISFMWIVFQVFLFGYLPFLISSIIWLIFEMRKIGVIKNMIEKGVPHDEAIERVMKKESRFKW